MARKWVLGAVLAVALLSAATAAPASATTICEDSACHNAWAVHSLFEGTGELTLGSIACPTTSFEFEITTGGGGATQTASINSFLLSGCSGGCTVTSVDRPWKAQITVGGTGPNGFEKLVSSGAGDPGFKFNCPSPALVCEYTATAINVAITGGTVAIFKTSAQNLSAVAGSPPGCGTTIVVNAVHEVSPLKGSGGFWVRT